MNKKLLKSFLLAVALLVGGNAWAAVGDKTTNLDIDFSNAISEGVVAGATGSITIGGSNTEITTDGILKIGNGTSTATLTGSAAGSGDQVVVSFDLAFGKLSGKSVWFRLKDADGGVIGEFNFTPYTGTLNTNTFGVATDDMYYSNNTVLWERKVSFTITLNYKTRKITTATTCYKSGSGKAATTAEHTVDMTNSKPMATFEIGSNYNNDDRRCQFDNLKVETIEGEAATTTSYTVNYKLGDNVVKTVSASDAVVGQVVTALTALDGEGTYAGNHYLITAATAPTMTLVADGASNVLNVPVRAPYTATLKVTKTIAGEAQPTVTTDLVETDSKVCSWAYAYSLYVEKDDKFYIADETSSFGETGTFSNGQTIEKTVTYTNEATDVVAFSEVGTGINPAYSGGGNTNVNINLAEATLSAGNYRAEIMVVSKGGSGSNHRGESVVVGETEVASTNSNADKLWIFDFNVADDNTAVYVKGNGNLNYTDNLDYVLIRKLPVTVPASITSTTGYATFSSTYALNFTGITTLTAYTATACDATNKTVTLTPVTGTVAANTGLVIKGETTNIPVVATGDTQTGNLLQPCDGSWTTLSKSSTGTNYVLSIQSGDVVFAPIGETSATLRAGSAYLYVPTSGDARALNIVFGDESTGISNVNADLNLNNNVYDLQGRRVMNAQKGLYIVNGKKVVIK